MVPLALVGRTVKQRGEGVHREEKEGWSRGDSGHGTLMYRCREDSDVGAVFLPIPPAPKCQHCGCTGIQSLAGSKVPEQ